MNFFVFINSRTPLSPEALCPLAEPLPPVSLGAGGVEAAGLTTELTVRFLEGEGGLRRRKAIKNKCKTQKSDSSSCHWYQRRCPSAFESLPTRRMARLPPRHGHPTPSDQLMDLQTKATVISRRSNNSIGQKSKRNGSQMHT